MKGSEIYFRFIALSSIGGCFAGIYNGINSPVYCEGRNFPNIVLDITANAMLGTGIGMASGIPVSYTHLTLPDE